MSNTGIRSLAQKLQGQGRGRDTILAHIMPEEAAMLKRMGGSGTVNPRTGLLEFDNPGMGSYDGAGDTSGNADTSSWGAGNFVTNNSGNGRDSSSSNQSPNYTVGNNAVSNNNGGGFNSANWGVGNGMLTVGTPTMVSSGGNWAPSGGQQNTGGGFFDGISNLIPHIGVPTIVSNAWNSLGNMFTPTPPPAPLIDDMGNQYHMEFGRKIVDKPATTPVPDYSNAVGDLRFLSPASSNEQTTVLPSGITNQQIGAMLREAQSPSSNDQNSGVVPELSETAISKIPVPTPRPTEFAETSVPAPRPTEIAAAPVSVAPAFRSGVSDVVAPQPTYNLAQTSGIAGLRSEATSGDTSYAPTQVAEVPKTLVEYDPVKMQGTYVVDVEKALNTFRPELQGFGTFASDEKLFNNVLGSLTGNETFKQSGSTVTPSEEKLDNGLPATITINAMGPETVLAMGVPKTPVSPEDENASYLTNYPAPSSFTTTASLQVPLPPERSVFGPEAGQAVPEVQVAEVAKPAQPAPQEIPKFTDFSSVGSLLDATFASLTDTGVPTKSVSYPFQDEVSPVTYADMYRPGMTYEQPTVVAQVRPPEESTPRPPAGIPQTVTPNAPIQVASLLDEEFNRIVSGDGGREQPYRKDKEQLTPPVETPTEPETPPARPTTGMDLTRPVYVSRPVSSNTTSPAYS